MALIKCPECENDISEKAKSCPKCGHPLTEAIVAPPLLTPIPPEEKPAKRNPWIIFAIVAGCFALCCLSVPVLAALLFPRFASAKTAALKVSTISNVKQIGTGLAIYQADNDDKFPASFSSNSDLIAAVKKHVKTESVFKTLNPDGGEILANQKLEGMEVFEVVNLTTTASLFETKNWKDGGKVYGFADTSAKLVYGEAVPNFDPRN